MKIEKLFSVKKKIALVTGSTGGLGSIFAQGLAKNGCTVILNSRSQKKIDLQVKQFKDLGYEVYGSVFDITDGDQVNKAIQGITNKVGRIDILVNNAGINLRRPSKILTMTIGTK